MNIADDIHRLERGIKALKIQYDQYFAGALPRQPLELKADVERLIRKYSGAPIRRLAERFHFNTLVSRFNSLTELYEGRLRAREEGRSQPGLALAGRGRDRRRRPGDGPRVLHQQLLRSSDRSEGSLRDFYDRFLEIRRSHGQPADGISFDNFERQILRKSEVVRTRASCDAVRLRLTLEGDRVHLRAIPVRRRNEK